MADAENVKPQQDEKGRFIAGNSGNGGRPKGARVKLGDEFMHDILNDWQTHGSVAIAEMREKDPGGYVRVVASTLPKELNVKVSELDELTDDQLARQLAHIVAELAAAGFGVGEGASVKATAEQALSLPAVH